MPGVFMLQEVTAVPMFLSPLARQLVSSLDAEPQRWQRSGRTLVRDDGVELQFIHPYARKITRPRLVSPRRVAFGGLEGYVVRRAIRSWLHRPI